MVTLPLSRSLDVQLLRMRIWLNETAASPRAISQILEQDNNTAKVKET
jgi:hypothetical protein